MKKYVILAISILLIQFGFAQTFSGIQIGGTIEQMKIKLLAKGFKFDEKKENLIWLTGKMATKNVLVGLMGTPKTKSTWKIVVIFDPKNSWNSLKTDYLETKEILNKKYGQCVDSFEFFSSPFSEGDGNELFAVESEKVTFSAFWQNIENGKMDLSIQIGNSKCVVLGYENNELAKLFKKEKTELEMDTF